MIIVLLADGFEEIEALTPVDMLRRAGLEVKTVTVSGTNPVGAHGIEVKCDATPDEIDLSKVDLAIFPGGMPGATNLDASPFTDKVIDAMLEKNGGLAAICAAPLIFGKRGLLKGKHATCYPGFEDQLVGAKIMDSGVVTDGNIITAKSMGVALEFSEHILSLLTGNERAAEISRSIYKMCANQTPKQTVCDEEYNLPEIITHDNRLMTSSNISQIKEYADKLNSTFEFFRIRASITKVELGPKVIRFSIVPDKGTKVSSIVNIKDDISLNLGAGFIRIEAPIPGASAIGIEIPYTNRKDVTLPELIESNEFKAEESSTAVCLGRGISGKPTVADITKFPHLLIGGATASGKSMLIHSMLLSLLSKATPSDVKLILIDPKQVEFLAYSEIPHLLLPIISNAKQAAATLAWTCNEMERRYGLLSSQGVRNIDAYNEKVDGENRLYRIIVIIDELADLMLQVKDPVEMLLCRIAQKARAAGIHLIIGTQRTSVNVITGIIKANVPSRICMRVPTTTDSKVMLDSSGAECLLPSGDALYAPSGFYKGERLHTPTFSTDYLNGIVSEVISKNGNAVYNEEIKSKIDEIAKTISPVKEVEPEEDDGAFEGYLTDRQFLDSVNVALSSKMISTSLIQRKLSIGYGKAAKFLDAMEEMGIIGPADRSKPRKVLITEEDWKKIASDRAAKESDTTIKEQKPDNNDTVVYASISDYLDSINSDLKFTIIKKDEAVNEKESEDDSERSYNPDFSGYTAPSLDLLAKDEPAKDYSEEIQHNSDAIISILAANRITASICEVCRGPRVTTYYVTPSKETRVQRITNLISDIALYLGVSSIRMIAPVPGKHAVGIEVPNKTPSIVALRDMLESEEFKKEATPTTVCIGRDTANKPLIVNLAKMPHILVAGATGMGKSVVVNSMLATILYNAHPNDVKLIMIDPKQVEFTPYVGIPHLLTPIIHDAKSAARALEWTVNEIDRRYSLLQKASVRNVDDYNRAIEKDSSLGDHLPKIIIVIDEFADLMLQAKDPVEALVTRIAQKARAVGIHLIISTQRPSVNVITGVIKANIPTRLCLKVISHIDSKTVLDCSGAERLCDRGDALYSSPYFMCPARIQSAYVSDRELDSITSAIKSIGEGVGYDPQIQKFIEQRPKAENDKPSFEEQFFAAVELTVNSQTASASLLQRKLSIGYKKASKFLKLMEEIGIVSEAEGNKARKVYLTPDEWAAKLERIKNEE